MRYSVEPRDMDFCLFLKTGKNLSNKYGLKLLDNAKKSTTDAIETASKRTIQKKQKQLVI